jgi:hypothetical protein
MVLGILGHHLRGEGQDFAGSRSIRRYVMIALRKLPLKFVVRRLDP